MTHPKQERGQALVVIALAMVAIIAIIGLVIDGGNAFLDRRNAQNAADAAALASALKRIQGNGDWVAAALESAVGNGYNNDGISNVVTVWSPPQSGPYSGNTEYIQVVITSHVPTYFAKVIGRSQNTNIVEAISRTKSSEISPILGGYAIISLTATSNCITTPAFYIHDSAILDLTGGGVFVNSPEECALQQKGDGSIRVNGGGQILVAGGISIIKPQLFSPNITIGVSSYSYPPPLFLPNAGCSEDVAEISEDGTSMTPGTWSGPFPPEGITQLESGVYCLDEGMTITGDLKGHEVTFVVNAGEVIFESTATPDLDAPKDGDNPGLLIYLPPQNTEQITIQSGSNPKLQGTIFAPASHILLYDVQNSGGIHSQIIGYTIEVAGDGTVAIKYNAQQNWHTYTMPEIQLIE